jgi:hypothetical protein
MAALFEDDERSSGNCFVDILGGNRRDIHVESSGDDHSGEFELWQLGREVEGSGCFLDASGDLRYGFEILDAGEVGVAVRCAVEEHKEMVADTLIGCIRIASTALFRERRSDPARRGRRREGRERCLSMRARRSR